MTLRNLIIAGIVAVLSLFAFMDSSTMIGAGERGVVLRMGAVTDEILGEGFHFVAPVIKRVVEVDVRTRKMELKDYLSTVSKDLQDVKTKIAVNYHPNPMKVNRIYQEYGHDVEERIIAPSILEGTKSITAKYTAEELITKRQQVTNDLKEALRGRMALSNIILTDVYITDFAFSKEFNAAIEAKVKAEQDAMREKNNLARVQFESQQKIVQAEAQAKAIKIQAEAITQQGGKDYVMLKAIEKWGGEFPQWMVPGGALPFMGTSLSGVGK
jgi:regulator of protease activity HflC (stomatin/prohibitin superfamily)